MTGFVIFMGSVLGGLFLGIFLMWFLYFPSVYESIRKSGKEIYELYKNKYENCPAYHIKRARSISPKITKHNAQDNNKEIVPENETINPVESDEILKDCKYKFHDGKNNVHNYCCCCCDHTLIECCEVSEGDIIKVIENVIKRK